MNIMLPDSGHIQERDAEWETRKRQRGGKRRVAPLYTEADARAVANHLRPVPYGTPVEPGQQIIRHLPRRGAHPRLGDRRRRREGRRAGAAAGLQRRPGAQGAADRARPVDGRPGRPRRHGVDLRQPRPQGDAGVDRGIRPRRERHAAPEGGERHHPRLRRGARPGHPLRPRRSHPEGARGGDHRLRRLAAGDRRDADHHAQRQDVRRGGEGPPAVVAGQPGRAQGRPRQGRPGVDGAELDPGRGGHHGRQRDVHRGEDQAPPEAQPVAEGEQRGDRGVPGGRGPSGGRSSTARSG